MAPLWAVLATTAVVTKAQPQEMPSSTMMPEYQPEYGQEPEYQPEYGQEPEFGNDMPEQDGMDKAPAYHDGYYGAYHDDYWREWGDNPAWMEDGKYPVFTQWDDHGAYPGWAANDGMWTYDMFPEHCDLRRLCSGTGIVNKDRKFQNCLRHKDSFTLPVGSEEKCYEAQGMLGEPFTCQEIQHYFMDNSLMQVVSEMSMIGFKIDPCETFAFWKQKCCNCVNVAQELVDKLINRGLYPIPCVEEMQNRRLRGEAVEPCPGEAAAPKKNLLKRMKKTKNLFKKAAKKAALQEQLYA